MTAASPKPQDLVSLGIPGLDDVLLGGSCFLFWLPAIDAADDQPKLAVEPATLQRPLNLLLVDDNVDAVESLAMLLRQAGHDVTTAYEAESALRALDRRAPDLAVLDIGLPGVDGYELARAIRARPQMKDIVLVALTGYGQPEDRGRAHEAGFDHHLIKPASFAELHGLLARTGT